MNRTFFVFLFDENFDDDDDDDEDGDENDDNDNYDGDTGEQSWSVQLWTKSSDQSKQQGL